MTDSVGDGTDDTENPDDPDEEAIWRARLEESRAELEETAAEDERRSLIEKIEKIEAGMVQKGYLDPDDRQEYAVSPEVPPGDDTDDAEPEDGPDDTEAGADDDTDDEPTDAPAETTDTETPDDPGDDTDDAEPGTETETDEDPDGPDTGDWGDEVDDSETGDSIEVTDGRENAGSEDTADDEPEADEPGTVIEVETPDDEPEAGEPGSDTTADEPTAEDTGSGEQGTEPGAAPEGPTDQSEPAATDTEGGSEESPGGDGTDSPDVGSDSVAPTGTESGDSAPETDDGEDYATADEFDALRQRLSGMDDRLDDLEQLLEEHKRADERAHDEIRQYATEDFAEDMLRVRDTLERALELFEWEGQKAEQMEGVVAQFDQQFTARDIDAIVPEPGDEFDYDRHEVVEREPDADIESGHVLRVERKGFSLSGRVIRPAQVVRVAEKTA